MSGLVGCQVQRNVFSDDGRVLLIERGSHLDGEYRIASVRSGTVRIPVLWTRIRTPLGVTVDIDSPGTGQLGESGIDGYVDNRWGERIGAANLDRCFLFIGYGTKVGLVPVHNWLPDAHAEGPTPVSAVLSGLLLNVALYAVLRCKMLTDGALGSSQLSGRLMMDLP